MKNTITKTIAFLFLLFAIPATNVFAGDDDPLDSSDLQLVASGGSHGELGQRSGIAQAVVTASFNNKTLRLVFHCNAGQVDIVLNTASGLVISHSANASGSIKLSIESIAKGEECKVEIHTSKKGSFNGSFIK